MNSTFAQFSLVNRTMGRQVDLMSSRGDVQREIENFVTEIANISSAEELVQDSRLLRFTLTAFGLESQFFAKALVQEVLESDLSDSRSLASRMTDRRFRDLAAAFNFGGPGTPNNTTLEFAQAAVQRFLSVKIEEEQGQQNEGVQLALFFQRQAPRINSYFDIFADPALQEVFRVALRLPRQIFTQDLDRLAVKLSERFDLAKLKDPEELDKFLKRFTILHDLENGGTGTGLPGIAQDRLSLFRPLPSLGGAPANAPVFIPPIGARGPFAF
ncbi:hypothetical protein GCM10007972_23890 [Iodidimonas muriae]|uniref:DUF1217 domain-containing protein n=1 Tax=Iodidimonas muriae TaxID=261467 RepID=A0ABQ2LFK9_9PROT|nr:DUF1217 domain-containing protein [Iodidimonas muriae]GER08569.1 hypothetical protein JCM17843_28790 [Kordiimonadales bacterium JCM 17843]GGO15602.1 hypothetical protein GCM10007972_23890 [Iodidimonas muriae]